MKHTSSGSRLAAIDQFRRFTILVVRDRRVRGGSSPRGLQF